MLSLVLGFVVGVGAYLAAATVNSRSEASVSVILNENAVGWPFYAAAQERATAIVDDPAEQRAIVEQLNGPGAVELSVERPGDLSLLRVIASADDDATAVEAAGLSANRLVARSLDEQRAFIIGERDDLQELAESAETDVAELQATLASSEADSDRIPVRADLEAAARQAADARARIAELEVELASTEAQFVVVGEAEIDDDASASLVAALAAGAGAAVLVLLTLSFIGSVDKPDD